jgi:signal transduction histidine kinase
VEALEDKIAALAEARDREQRFAADVAHELRTPIGAILTAASHLADDPGAPAEDARDVGRIIVASARRLERLTSELLELHRLEAGQLELQIEDVDLGTAARHAVAANGWVERVEVVDPGSPVLVQTDRRRLDRIVVNLVANAVRHGGCRIRVVVSDGDESAWLTVSDDGAGIPAAALPHVFDRHYKVSGDRSAVVDDGSGLGLAIAHESAERLHGSLSVSSTEGVGTTFTLWLPREPMSVDGGG